MAGADAECTTAWVGAGVDDFGVAAVGVDTAGEAAAGVAELRVGVVVTGGVGVANAGEGEAGGAALAETLFLRFEGVSGVAATGVGTGTGSGAGVGVSVLVVRAFALVSAVGRLRLLPPLRRTHHHHTPPASAAVMTQDTAAADTHFQVCELSCAGVAGSVSVPFWSDSYGRSLSSIGGRAEVGDSGGDGEGRSCIMGFATNASAPAAEIKCGVSRNTYARPFAPISTRKKVSTGAVLLYRHFRSPRMSKHITALSSVTISS